MIPQIFHTVWLSRDDDDPIPDHGLLNHGRLWRLHPKWRFRLWTEQDHDTLFFPALRPFIDKITNPAGLSDLARYSVIAQHGGIYVDWDIEPLKEFTPVLDNEIFMSWESADRLCPSVMGCTQNNTSMIEFLEWLPSWLDAHANEPDPVILTGPIPLTEFFGTKSHVKRYPMHYFYPFGYQQDEQMLAHSGTLAHDNSLAIHHWNAGWKV